jgi:hypothetical protein
MTGRGYKGRYGRWAVDNHLSQVFARAGAKENIDCLNVIRSFTMLYSCILNTLSDDI